MKRETALLVLLYVLTIIGCVLSYHLGAEVERLKQNAARSDNWRPLPFINELTMHQMSQSHTSATNPAPFDRRRRPIHGISDHTVHVSIGKSGIWPEADGFLRNLSSNQYIGNVYVDGTPARAGKE